MPGRTGRSPDNPAHSRSWRSPPARRCRPRVSPTTSPRKTRWYPSSCAAAGSAKGPRWASPRQARRAQRTDEPRSTDAVRRWNGERPPSLTIPATRAVAPTTVRIITNRTRVMAARRLIIGQVPDHFTVGFGSTSARQTPAAGGPLSRAAHTAAGAHRSEGPGRDFDHTRYRSQERCNFRPVRPAATRRRPGSGRLRGRFGGRAEPVVTCRRSGRERPLSRPPRLHFARSSLGWARAPSMKTFSRSRGSWKASATRVM